MSAAPGPDFDCVVVGAGVIGMTMASLLIARELAAPGRVAVIADHRGSTSIGSTSIGSTSTSPEAEWDLRVFALSQASQRVLAACNAWQWLPVDRRFAYERMCVWDAGGTPARGALNFDCAELGEPNLGFIVEGRALQNVCRRAAAGAGAVFLETAIAGLTHEATAVRVALTDGREVKARLLIAADGVDSPTRALLGIETAGHAYDQDALVAHVRTAEPHRRTARQRFLATGPLAFLPLPDGRSSIVWSAVRTEAARLRALSPGEFGAALTAASGGVLGSCELTTPVASFALKLQYALDYVRPRAVLVGDAAHTVHPLAGQGLNLGLLDCATLVQVLGDAGGGVDPGGESRVLGRYERWRRGENLLAAAAMDGLERVFASDAAPLVLLRAAALAAAGRSAFIRRQLAARAMGRSGDIPAFLQAYGPN